MVHRKRTQVVIVSEEILENGVNSVLSRTKRHPSRLQRVVAVSSETSVGQQLFRLFSLSGGLFQAHGNQKTNNKPLNVILLHVVFM